MGPLTGQLLGLLGNRFAFSHFNCEAVPKGRAMKRTKKNFVPRRETKRKMQPLTRDVFTSILAKAAKTCGKAGSKETSTKSSSDLEFLPAASVNSLR